ncbi:hypothetical protein [Mycobacterium malmoense]|uniref:hypothetical protein n=1 Tax=Mycobacterium malmoense TaxID=1780 RepID=UPI00091C232F|nr:hypothetical protein [Mycobacterium malmoense]OIN81821.1 hypothetical protein BMG05_05290 [Mycobacterium malmoense]
MSSESVGIGNQFCDIRRLDGTRFPGVLDIGDPLVVIISDPSQPFTQAIDCIRTFVEGSSFHLVFFG